MRRGQVVTVRDTPGRWEVATTRPVDDVRVLWPADADAFLYLLTAAGEPRHGILRHDDDLAPVERPGGMRH